MVEMCGHVWSGATGFEKPAIIGWEAKQRQVDLTIERPFKGDELLKHMKDWATADVY